MRKFLLTAASALLLPMAVSAQTTTEHVIERGESIESIAKTYGVSKQALLDSNPGLKDMFFSGIIIKIPAANTSNDAASQQTVPAQNTATEQSSVSGKSQKQTTAENKNSFTHNGKKMYAYSESKGRKLSGGSNSDKKGSNALRFKLGYSVNSFVSASERSNDKTKYTSGPAIDFNLLFRHNFSNCFYGEIGTGVTYQKYSAKDYNDGSKTKNLDLDLINIPVNLYAGYTLSFSDKMGLDIYTGPSLSIGASSKLKGDSETGAPKTPFGFGWGLGTQLNISGFNVGINYNFPITNNMSLNRRDFNIGNTVVYLGYTLKL